MISHFALYATQHSKVRSESARVNLQTEIFGNGQQGVGFIKRVEMQSWNAKPNEIFALTRRILNPHLDRCFLVVLNPHQLVLQFRRNLGAAERGETAHLWRGKNRQNSRHDWNRNAHGSEVVDKSVIIFIIEKKFQQLRKG